MESKEIFQEDLLRIYKDLGLVIAKAYSASRYIDDLDADFAIACHLFSAELIDLYTFMLRQKEWEQKCRENSVTKRILIGEVAQYST